MWQADSAAGYRHSSPSRWQRESVPHCLLSISYLPPLLLTLESEASSSQQRTEKPQNPSNHFQVVQTLRQPNPYRHLRNNYFLEFGELFGHFELPLSSPAISSSLSDASLAFGAV